MKSRINICFAIGILLLLTTCGDNNPASTNDDDPVDPNVESKEIGPAGGNLTSKDGLLTLTIPAGALDESQTITVKKIAVDDLGSEFSELTEAGGISEAYELGPDGLQFDEPITVKFKSSQTPVQTADSIGAFSEFMLTSSGSSVEFLDSLFTHIDIDNSKIEVEGQLSHFSPLVITESNNGVTFFVKGVPAELEVGSAFTAEAIIIESDTGPLADLVTVPGPAEYLDMSGSPLIRAFEPGKAELAGESVTGFKGSFEYGCSDTGFGTYASEISVNVTFGLDSGDISAVSFADFFKLVECVPEALPTFALTVELDGDGSGTVSSDPDGIDCLDDCTEDFTQGMEIILEANPAEGSEFVNWTGDLEDDVSPDASSIILKMDQNRTVTAVFRAIPSYTLEVLKDGTGTGTVTSNPPGIDYGGDNTEDYPENTVVTLTASPDEGSIFKNWSENGVNFSTNTSIQVTMDQARTITATFDQSGGSGNTFSSGTGFPQGISFIPNPWGLLSFNTECSFLMVIAGGDLAFVDPCNGATLVVLDITFEMSSTGLNGLIPLLPVQDANGVTRNWLLLTSQSRWFLMEIVLDNQGNPQIGEIRGSNGGFVLSASGTGGQDGTTGGTNSAIITGEHLGRVYEESSDMSIEGSYDGIGQVLLDVVSGKMPGTPLAAYRQSDENGTPGDIIGVVKITENGTSVSRAFTSSFNSETGEYNSAVTSTGTIDDDTRDMTCQEKPNPNTDEAEVLCITANLLGESISFILKKEDNSVEVRTENPIDAPIAIDSRLTPEGNIQVIVVGFTGQVYVAEYDFTGSLINQAEFTLPPGVDGISDVRFDPNNPGRGFASGQNSDNIVVIEF